MRGVLYSLQGRKLFTSQIQYSPDYLEQDRVEQDPVLWKEAMEENLRACVRYGKEAGEKVEAVALTAQRSSVIPVDEKGHALRPAIMWQDKRVTGILEGLKDREAQIFSLTGSRLNPVFSGPKMAWIRACEPEIYEKAHKLAVVADYLIYHMTGQWVTDATYGSRSLLMNLSSRQWDPELLELFGIQEEKLCPIIEPGSAAGFTTEELGKRTGITPGIPVITAGGDQQCAALGMGIIRPGTIEISAGTGAYIIGAASCIPEGLTENVICNASAIPGAYVLESGILSCASAFNWFLRLCYGMTEENRRQVYERVNLEMEKALEKEDSLLVLPFFQGRGTPDWNSAARGTFHNMTLGTERGDLARAVLEGLCCEISVNIDIIRGYIGREGRIYGCGGLVNSPVFLKLLSGTCGSCIDTYTDNEAAAIGGWMAAVRALGICRNYEEAFDRAREGHSLIRTEADQRLGQHCLAIKDNYSRLYSRLYREASADAL